jgi:DNA-binding transcriptional ArsR family regulator
MRALAHPVRLAILDFLRTAGAATATQCAEAVGESPSSCSYHLRTLARWGFVEEAEGDDRRERPWRQVTRRFAWSSEDATSPEDIAAGRVILDATLARDDRIVSDFLAHEGRVDAARRGAAAFIGTTLVMTPDEAITLRRQFERLIEPYIREQPEERPSGAVAMHVIFRSVPLVDDVLHAPTGPPERTPPA